MSIHTEQAAKKDILWFASRLCLAALVFFMCTYIVRIGTRAYVKFSGKTNAFTQWVFRDDPLMALDGTDEGNVHVIEHTDWQALYPFTAESHTAGRNMVPQSAVQRAEQCIRSLEDAFTTWITENLLYRFFFIEWANRYDAALGWNLATGDDNGSDNQAVFLTNGYLTVFQKKVDASVCAESLLSFNDFLKTQQTPLLYIQAPYKICRFDKAGAEGRDFSNENADEFVRLVRAGGVPVLDMREELHRAGRSHYASFFITDHHWKPETGLWAAGVIARWLNAHVPNAVDEQALLPERFNRTVYPHSFLGSHGRKVTLARTEPEDFTLITPKADTAFECEIYTAEGKIVQGTGSYNLLLDMTQLASNDYYNSSVYATYMYGDTVAEIRNLYSTDNAKLLLIGDSFTDVAEPFLALGVSELDCIDLRVFTGSLQSYITQNGPYDAVLALYNPSSFGQTIDWDSHTDLYDFR